jgi:ABC-type bacteriocin/lantibiotic exporter with double-glycine peptidase domain
MVRKALWKKIFKYQQKSGWCGPAVIQMALLAGGIKISQEKIARDVYRSWWGTTQQTMYAYLSRFYKNLGFRENSKLRDISYHLKRKRFIIVNWWDNLVPEEGEDGHYSVIFDYDNKERKITLGDPSAGRGIWKMKASDFNDRWYDSLDLHNKKWVEGFLLWVDPKSKI